MSWVLFLFQFFKEMIGALATSSGEQWDTFFVVITNSLVLYTSMCCVCFSPVFLILKWSYALGAPFLLMRVPCWHDFTRLIFNSFITLNSHTIHSPIDSIQFSCCFLYSQNSATITTMNLELFHCPRQKVHIPISSNSHFSQPIPPLVPGSY